MAPPSFPSSHLWVALGEVGFMNSGVDLVINVDVLFPQTFSKDSATIFENYYVSRVRLGHYSLSLLWFITKWTREHKSKAIVRVHPVHHSLLISTDFL